MVNGSVITIVCLPALLTLVCFFEVLAAALPCARRVVTAGALSHRTTVLIPAHNEGVGVLPTIRDIQAQLGPNDSILVVADNCNG